MKFKIILGRIGSDIWANCRLKIIHKEFKYLKDKKILDIGCGSGYIGKSFLKNNQVTFADINQKELDKIQDQKAIIKRIDLNRKLPFKDNYFDLIICADVLEHLENTDNIMKEFKRILKGSLIITAPAYSKLYGVHDKLINHYRRYDKIDYINMAKENNLQLKIRYIGSFILIPFIFSQKFKSSKVFYNGKSKLEEKNTFLLNIICNIDNSLRLPFGICIMGIFTK